MASNLKVTGRCSWIAVPKNKSAQLEVRMDTIKGINNITETVKDVLYTTIYIGNKASVTNARLSMYTFLGAEK